MPRAEVVALRLAAKMPTRRSTPATDTIAGRIARAAAHRRRHEGDCQMASRITIPAPLDTSDQRRARARAWAALR